MRAVDLDSDSFLARWFLSGALHSAKRLDESMASGEMALAMSGRHPCVVGSLATIFADCGKPVDAEALYEELVARARRSYVQPSQLAIAASAADKKDDKRYPWFVRNYGNRCWELDAMDPNDLRACVKREIKKLIEPVAWKRCEVVNKAEQDSLRGILQKWGKP